MSAPTIFEYLRVTEILSPFSGLSHIDPYVLRNAAERGTRVHQYCDLVIDSLDLGLGIPDPEEDIKGYVESFIEWQEGKKFIKKPSRLYCDKYLITGEIDGLYEDETGIVLYDLKTPASEGKTWKHQGSAYSYLCSTMGITPYKIEFVKLSKEGKKAKSYFYEENIEEFFLILQIYKMFFDKKNKPDYLENL